VTKNKNIYIIYTGGTIGMKKSFEGYVPEAGLLTKIMQSMPEFKHQDMPEYTINEYTPLIDSSNMQPAHWQLIADDIAKNYDEYDGFLILHGTDTMAYTASALSFMLSNLAKPVILTGAQVALIETHTDARENLIMAILMAANPNIHEVCIYFNNLLLRGNRSSKINAFSFAAFGSPNFPALAKVGIAIKYRKELLLPKPSTSLNVQQINTISIAQFVLFPGMDLHNLEQIILQKPRAIILHTYGVGNAPTSDPKLLALLTHAKTLNILIINHTQCHKGSVAMHSYATGYALSEHGVISAYDMTIEAITTKLMVLFSQYQETSQVAALFEKNMCGEVTI